MTRAGAPVDPWWILGLVRRGFRVLAMTALGGIAVGALLAAFAVPAKWESRALLVIDRPGEESNPWAEQNALSEGAELLMHSSTLRRVRERVGYGGTVESLAARLQAEADRSANVLRVTALAPTRDEAVVLARSAVDAFLDVRRESERARLTERLGLRRNELAAAQGQLVEARAEYDAFRAEHGISNLTVQQESAIAELSRLTLEMAEEEVSAIGAAARMAVLRREARRLPEMTTATARTTDLVETELAQARAELAQARGRYTDDHPTVMGLEARVAALARERRRGSGVTRTEATTAMNPVRLDLEGNAALAAADRATAEQRRAGLERLAERARERVRSLGALEGRVSMLLAAIRIGEEQVEALQRDIARTEDLLREPPPGFHVAAPASVPEAPLRARGRWLALLMPPTVALLVAFAFLFWRERGGPWTHTPVEVAWWGHAPVIGTTTWPREREALDLLVGELEDLGPYATGRTLVVPATAAERELATEFAGRLAEAPWLAAGALEAGEEPRSDGATSPVLPEEAGSPEHRPTPTKSLALAATPAPAGEGTSGPLVHRATVRLVGDGPGSERDGAPGGARGAKKATSRGKRGRTPSGRVLVSAPRVLVGPDVRVGSIVPVGDEPASAAVWSGAPPGTETREVHVSGTVDDGRGAPTPFEVRADAPVERDAVLLLAMRILGDVVEDPASLRAVVDPRRSSRRASDVIEPRPVGEPAVVLPWTGALQGPTLRRAVRLADRVIVLVREGTLTPADLATLQTRLGREDAIGFLVVGASESTSRGPDRVGPVAEFWASRKRLPA